MNEIVLTYGNNVLDFGGNIPSFDLFSGSFGIYSVRKVVASYTGPAMRVVRSDLTELDIYFIGNDLDTASLLAFSDNINVMTWYDQSGNDRHATSPSDAQMEIVNAGVLYTRNGKPALRSNSSSIRLNLPDTYNIGTEYSLLGVVEWTNLNTEWLGGGGNIYGIYQDGSYMYYNGLNGTYFRGDNLISLNSQCVVEIHRTDLDVLLYVNNTQANRTIFGSTNIDFLLNNLNGETIVYGLRGYLQETIIIPTNRLAERNAIYDNISGYFR